MCGESSRNPAVEISHLLKRMTTELKKIQFLEKLNYQQSARRLDHFRSIRTRRHIRYIECGVDVDRSGGQFGDLHCREHCKESTEQGVSATPTPPMPQRPSSPRAIGGAMERESVEGRKGTVGGEEEVEMEMGMGMEDRFEVDRRVGWGSGRWG